MKAKYDPKARTKFLSSCRKEGKCYFSSMSVISLAEKPWGDGRIGEPVTLRLYGTGRRNYACLWVNAEPIHTRGSGWAGGGGYHRPSAAAGEAISNAGFSLDQSIGGVGESAMREALLAIAKCIGVRKPALVEAHP